MTERTRCTECGSTRKGDEFEDGTGYECPECMSNVFWTFYGACGVGGCGECFPLVNANDEALTDNFGHAVTR